MTDHNRYPKTGYGPRIDEFFERFPSARALYAAGKLYHMTRSMNMPGIMREGLRSNAELFPAAHGQFCSIYAKVRLRRSGQLHKR